MEAMARSLIRQLSRSPLTAGVKNLWDTHGRKGSEPGFAAISDALQSLLSSISGEIYLVLDALDECPQDGETKERKIVLSLLNDLFKRQSSKIHILVTSRPLNDIEKGLPSFTRIDLQEQLAKDVETFATLAVTQGDLEEWGADIHKLILDELLSSKERYVKNLSILRYALIANFFSK